MFRSKAICHRLSVAGLAMLLASSPAMAKPNYGTCNNSGCHTSAKSAVNVVGNNGTANPAGGIGNLKSYNVQQGSSVTLQTALSGFSGKYSVALYGVQDVTGFTADAAWTNYTTRYTTAVLSTVTTQSFQLGVATDLAPGYYPLEFMAAGTSGGKWQGSEQFYVHVTEIPEPTSLITLMGMSSLAVFRRRRKGRPT
ncbi:MAG: PEP-CTERM sorting domain-containing protein [Phycisphaeraceae bacterium]|nr:PEP-CTERM sorting domain-containing protein [Phycisphaeraceae bacterium]